MKIQQLSGLLIFISFIITLYSYFLNDELFIFAGVFAWIALVLLFKYIPQKSLLILLIVLTSSVIIYSLYNGFEINFEKAILVNQHLLTLLIGVGFLRLIATPKKRKIKSLPLGKKSFLKTYLGVHLFGSVINLSSLILVADKLYKKGPLTNLQVLLLTRAFSSDAYWSPFFVAFAAALTYAPNLSTSVIMINGLFLAAVAFIFTYFEVTRNKEFALTQFRGYPIHFETLYIPVLLAVFVLTITTYNPELKVIILISFFSVIMTITILPIKIGLKKAFKRFSKHLTKELPLMKNELALFLVAGAFGVAISSILVGFEIDMPIKTFDATSASGLLLIMICLSFVGIHPIISIAIIGNWMGDVNHTLLAITFLMSWSTAVSTSPFSGVNLTMHARYNLSVTRIFKINIFYAIKMYFVCVMMLFLVSNYLGL